jgi:biotin-dependent carboxylase-like uncharacterized protein
VKALEVLAAGPLSLVQDLGRHGWGPLGVGDSGAFDRGAHRLGNRLVGNRESAATLEVLGAGLALRALGPCVIAVTGCEGSLTVERAGRPHLAVRRSPLHLIEDDILTVGMPVSGVRSYVCVRGGLRVPTTLGSASRDTLAQLGPEPLAAGDVVAIGAAAVTHPLVDHAPLRHASGPLRVVLGPRDDWFTADAVTALLSATWTVSTAADRVGLRLDGPELRRRDPGRELPSEPVVTGALQVPPDGRPVVLGPDHPTTGGYPVIAVVVDADRDRLAQLVPGQTLDVRKVNVL